MKNDLNICLTIDILIIGFKFPLFLLGKIEELCNEFWPLGNKFNVQTAYNRFQDFGYVSWSSTICI